MRNTTSEAREADWEKEGNRLASIDLTAQARAICDDILARWSADPRVFVSRRVSQEIGGHGPSHQTRLERTSETCGQCGRARAGHGRFDLQAAHPQGYRLLSAPREGVAGEADPSQHPSAS